MDLVLVGLPGSGKTEVARRLARRLGAAFVDTDREVEELAGRSIDEIFRTDGEAAFRELDRRVVAGLGGADPAASVRRIVATGGGTVVDPRNRWHLYRNRRVIWLDAPEAVLADRLRRSPTVRPLLAGRDLASGLEDLRAVRERFYGAGERVDASDSVAAIVEAIEALVARGGGAPTTPLMQAELSIGSTVLGDGIAAAAIDAALRRLDARRAIVVTEPRAWAAVERAIAGGLEAVGWPIERVDLPEGEAAKRLSVVEAAAGELARLGVERAEPILAIGGGALTDVAGFVAATYQRGIPWIAVPTTLLGQLDAAHGGKTGVDIDAGKNLVGAFHLPEAVIVDVALLATLPARHRRAALAEAVKDGVLGDERLLEVLEQDGPAVAEGRADGTLSGHPSALAEIVERAAWTKLASVEADPREHGDRIKLNLGHTLGHAIEAVAGFGPVLHGEAVAYGLRAATRLGERLGVTPPARAGRIEGLLDRLDLGCEPLALPIEEVLAVIERDKKRRAGTVRWLLPTGDGWTVVDGIDQGLVRLVAADVLAGRAGSEMAPTAATPPTAAVSSGGARS
jgi:shikimate kinase/3-dehydroquinate synthase